MMISAPGNTALKQFFSSVLTHKFYPAIIEFALQTSEEPLQKVFISYRFWHGSDDPQHMRINDSGDKMN